MRCKDSPPLLADGHSTEDLADQVLRFLGKLPTEWAKVISYCIILFFYLKFSSIVFLACNMVE